jgi:chemotaxis receptor (MCP) glutamine deamidase CheD
LYQVKDPTVNEVLVAPDEYAVTRGDGVLLARLQSTFALCIYDAVQENGALIHLRTGTRGRQNDPELTDTTLSTELLLLDRCLADLKKLEPRARHWQAKLVGEVEDVAGARVRFEAMQAFLAAYLGDAEIKLVSCSTHVNDAQTLRFRPAMAQVNCETRQD